MGPKRGRKKVTQVVKTTKVVEETVVQVSIVNGTQSQSQSQSATTVSTTKTIPIQQEPEIIPLETPPRQEEARPAQNEASHQRSVVAVGSKKVRRRRMRRKKEEGYKSYVYKVLKQVHPGLGVSGKAMTVINNLMSDMFQRLALEASKLGVHAKKQTLSAREIQSAVKLVLPAELANHAIAEASKALTNYLKYPNNY